MKEGEIIINIESCMENMNQESECPNVGDDKVGHLCSSFKVCGKPMSLDVLGNGESPLKPPRDADGVSISPDSGEKNRKERRLSMSAKKPPRPPRGLSLDAADQKLIKEISELLMIKRARIERMKALRKAKAAKGMPSSTSSSGNLLALVFTVIFCIAIIFQGCHPWGIFARKNSAVGMPVSSESDGATKGEILSRNLSIRTIYMLDKFHSPNLVIQGSNGKPVDGEAFS